MPVTETAQIEREIHIEARPATVFEFFTDPEKACRWMGKDAELDPRPGGIYRVDVTGEDVARGEFAEVDPPHRVVFTWGWESGESPVPSGSSTVEILLAPDGDGTRLTLRHSGLPEESVAPHAHGWEHYLERLRVAAAGGDPGRDPWIKD
jgi:uncharacterized protein YndB with AHSA1/START domain